MTEIIKRLVIVESPFKGNTPEEQEENITYGRACLHDCLVNHGEAPFASHLLYTQEGVLNDADPGERMQGIEAGFTWRPVAAATVVYVDKGISKGMEYGIKHAQDIGQMIEYRTLPKSGVKVENNFLTSAKAFQDFTTPEFSKFAKASRARWDLEEYLKVKFPKLFQRRKGKNNK